MTGQVRPVAGDLPPASSPTIADVARHAGVSTATVSRVLAGLGGAAPATSERVLDAARRLGYRPSGVARSLKLRTTRTFGLIVTDIENPFFPQLVRAVEDAANAAGYAVLLCNAVDDPSRELAYLELLADRRVDGVVIAAASLGRRQQAWLAEAPVPVVLVNGSVPGTRIPSIESDNAGGGRLATEHLLALGHRRLAALTAPRNADAAARLAGVRDAVSGPAAELAVGEGDPTVAGGEAATDQVLAAQPGTTGIVAYNDLMAIGAMRVVRASGRRVPDDVSVVGFDDIGLASLVEPPLTTVAQSTVEMGRWAIERLTAAVRGESAGSPGPLPVRLVVRGSTGLAPPQV
jgi:LacI family transcriptional regulator